MKNLKKENGVTLVALVVTIIVLLILAVVSFSIIMGDNGVLKKAVVAGDTTKAASAEEAMNMRIGEYVAEYYQTKYTASGTTSSTTGEYKNAGAYVMHKLGKSGKIENKDYTTDGNTITITWGADGETTSTTVTDNGSVGVWNRIIPNAS